MLRSRIFTSLSRWTCQFPVHHVVGKYKTIQCSVTCAMTTFARKNVTKTFIRFSGKNISWLSLKLFEWTIVLPLILFADPVMKV
jgi:hypothetical protein